MELIPPNFLVKCDLQNENQTSLHFSKLYFMTSFYPEGKTNGPLKFIVSGFGVIAIDSQASKTINLYSGYVEKTL